MYHIRKVPTPHPSVEKKKNLGEMMDRDGFLIVAPDKLVVFFFLLFLIFLYQWLFRNCRYLFHLQLHIMMLYIVVRL